MARVLIAGGGTGGHLMPALALADALCQVDREIEPVLVGASRGVDRAILPTRPYRHHLLDVEPIYRRTWWRNVRWPAIAWRVWRQCGQVLDTEQPALAVSTGGYAAGPVLVRAHYRHIPVALQEQNAYPGVTTRLLARIAAQVHLGFPEAREHLRIGKHEAVFCLGNPIVPPPRPLPDRALARRVLRIPAGMPVVLVVGGSQGARSINQTVARALESSSLAGVVLLWSTGPTSWDEYAHLDDPPTRQVRPFWDPIADAYAATDLVVARAGAMSTAEFCAWGLPSILIPLPTAAADHQSRNAAALAAGGAALHLPESQMTPETLAEHVKSLLGAPARLEAMAQAARARGRPGAALAIADQLRSLMS